MPVLCDDNGKLSPQNENSLNQMIVLDSLKVWKGLHVSSCDFRSLTTLQHISLANNEVTTIHPEHFHGLLHLDVISLNKNPLSSLPNVCMPDVVVELVNIAGLTCDCSHKYLKYLVADSEDTPCLLPATMEGVTLKDLEADNFTCHTG